MTLQEAIATSKNLAESIDRDINGLEFPASDRARLTAALLDQAHEHHNAIRTLLEQGMSGSAFSLVRILFETTVRGIWLLHCASEDELDKFKEDTLGKRFGSLVKDVEAFFGTNGGALSKVKSDYWQAMCSYAHGGYLQAVRRITSEHIAPAYSEDEKVEAIRFSDFCFLLAAVVIFSTANRTELADKWGASLGVSGDAT